MTVAPMSREIGYYDFDNLKIITNGDGSHFDLFNATGTGYRMELPELCMDIDVVPFVVMQMLF